MLSPLQIRVAGIVARLEEAAGFALAGGAALIARGDVDRYTRDLDFFGLSPETVERLVPAAEHSFRAAGLDVSVSRRADGYARLVVTDGSERTAADFGLARRTTLSGRVESLGLAPARSPAADCRPSGHALIQCRRPELSPVGQVPSS